MQSMYASVPWRENCSQTIFSVSLYIYNVNKRVAYSGGKRAKNSPYPPLTLLLTEPVIFLKTVISFTTESLAPKPGHAGTVATPTSPSPDYAPIGVPRSTAKETLTVPRLDPLTRAPRPGPPVPRVRLLHAICH